MIEGIGQLYLWLVLFRSVKVVKEHFDVPGES